MSEKNQPVLIVLHQEMSTPGRVGVRLREMGYELDVRKPRFGDKLPETMDDHAGALIFGGPMSANDPDDFIKQEIDWLEVPLRDNKPFLGICLGAQMLAKQLGAEVVAHPEQKVEVGYYPIIPSDRGREMFDWPSHVYQWHTEGFALPEGAELLAAGETYDNQAFSYGDNAYAIQFHPEVNLAMMHRWTVRGARRFVMDGAQNRAQQFQNRPFYDQPLKKWLHEFLDFWLSGQNK